MLLKTHRPVSSGNATGNKITGIVIAAIAAVVVIGVVFILINSGSKTAFSHKYTSVQPSAVKSKDNLSVSLKKPAEFTPQYKDVLSTPFQIYTQNEVVGNKTVTTGYLFVSASPLAADEKSVVDTVNHAFTKNPNDPYYKSAKRPMESYVDNIYSGLYKTVTVGNPTALQTPNLKKDAYIFDVSASGAKNGAPDQQGKAIYTWTDNAVFFYILSVAKENWQPNLATWQDMINSFKPVEKS